MKLHISAKTLTLSLFLLISVPVFSTGAPSPLAYIDTHFENASPLFWETGEDGTIQIHLLYDQERNSPNRANGHFHFRLEAAPGSRFTLVLNNLKNVWNGRPGCPLSERSVCKISTDGQKWETIKMEAVDEYRYKFEVEMKTDSLYVAHLEPYRISDLDTLLAEIRDQSRVRIETIGRTVQNRPLEIIRIGRDNAPHRVLIRARSHPWESGGNWVVQGLIHSLLSDDPSNEKYLSEYAVCILPMANKDGVALGLTRFNLRGMDLNRNWDRPADPALSPENHALEQWLESEIAAGRRPDLAFDLHNDQDGLIHISRPNINLEDYLKNMDRYESLLRKHTWFTEGRTGGDFRNSGTFGEGLVERFGITAFVQELNANWIEGLQDYTGRENWERLGSQYREVFYRYFSKAP